MVSIHSRMGRSGTEFKDGEGGRDEIGLTIPRRPEESSLKITSLEKCTAPFRSRTTQPTRASLYPTKMASKQRGLAFVRSSGGIVTRHWQPQIRRWERSSFLPVRTSKGVILLDRVDVG